MDLAVATVPVLVPVDLTTLWREDSLDEVPEAKGLVEDLASIEALLDVAGAFGRGRRCEGGRGLVLEQAMTPGLNEE